MANMTNHASLEPPVDHGLDLNISASTRQSIGKLRLERKKSSDRTERKNSILESASKWGDQDDEEIFKKRGSPRKTKKKDLLSASDHIQGGGTPYAVSRPGDNAGGLGDMLGHMNAKQPLKKRGARTVASMPAGATQDISSSSHHSRSSSRRGSSRGRSKSPHGLKSRRDSIKGGESSHSRSGGKKRSSSVGPMEKKRAELRERRTRSSDSVQLSPLARSSDSPKKKRSSSQGPLEKERSSRGRRSRSSDELPLADESDERPKSRKSRSSSAGPLKKRSSSPGALKKRSSSPGRLHKSSSVRSRRTVDGDISNPGDESGRLGSMLGKMGKPKKRGTRSVASAPAEAAELPRRSRRSSSKGPLGDVSKRRRARSTDLDDSLVAEEKVKPVVRRTKSADDVDDFDEWNDTSTKKSMKKKSSRRSEATSSTHQGDSSSIEQEERRNTSSDDRRAALAGTKAPLRSQSAQPAGAQHSKTDDPMRTQSMMLHRTAARRVGKSNSLANLVEYAEDEIHSTSYFASNHVLVNRERMKRGLRPLTRNIAMDEQARENAQRMADSAGTAPLTVTYIGNVLKGESIRAVHRATMSQREGRERANLLNPYFQEFGVGTAKGEDGMLYVCQLFSERLELTCTTYDG